MKTRGIQIRGHPLKVSCLPSASQSFNLILVKYLKAEKEEKKRRRKNFFEMDSQVNISSKVKVVEVRDVRGGALIAFLFFLKFEHEIYFLKNKNYFFANNDRPF